MSGTVPPIPPPLGNNLSTYGSPNRVDTMPTDNTNNTTTTNVAQSVVNEDLPQLLDSRGGSHVINVPAFKVEDFSSWKDKFLVYLDGLEPYLIEILENKPFVPMSSLSTSINPLTKPQKQWSPEDIKLVNKDKRLKRIIISYLLNDVMNYVIKCTTANFMCTNLILAHEGLSDIKDTKIAALRLKFNAFKAFEGEKAKVNAIFVNNLPRKWLSMNQTQRANNSIKNDTLATLYGKYNYKEGLIDQIYESETSRFTIQASSSKALVSNIHFQDNDSDDEESISFKDEWVTKVKAFLAIVKKEPSVGKADARSDYTHVDLHYAEDQRKNLLNKFNSLNQELSSYKSEVNDLKNTKALNCSLQNEITRVNLESESLKDEISDLKKADGSPSEIVPEITSDSKSECDIQEPLPLLYKLIGAEPTVSPVNVKKKTETKSPSVSDSCPNKKAESSTKKPLLTLMKECIGVAAAVVAARGGGDRIDPGMRSNFRFRQKSFPAAAAWWWPECWPEKMTGGGGSWVVAGDGRRKTFPAVAAGGRSFGREGENYKCFETHQTLKNNLCDAPILSLPDGVDDFVVYCDASNQGLGCVLMQRGKCEIRYHPGKTNVMADALSMKEQVKPRRVRAMAMIIQSGMKEMIMAAQSEAFKQENVLAERLHGLDQQMERKEDESLYFMDRIWVPLVGDVRMVILNEAHKSNYYVHPGVDKIYYDLRDMYWWPGMKRAIVFYAEIREGSLIRPELVLQTTDKVVLIKEKLKAASDRQKSYVDKRRKPLEFEVGDRVLLKVSSWKGVARFGRKGKLAPRYMGPFEILERIGLVAYRLRLPEELSSMHDTFHVSNLRKFLADARLHVPLKDIKVDKTLCFVEEPVEIMDREVKRLKRRKIALVKVRWDSKRGPEFTWKHEDQMRIKYPQLFMIELLSLLVKSRDEISSRRGYYDTRDLIRDGSIPIVHVL
ncbi:putative reverse transcriptase domain-containing protein [Tanacetum coccineum]